MKSSTHTHKQKQKLVNAVFQANTTKPEMNTNASFETCSVQFGKLNITVNSMNSVPTFQSFYETIPCITSKQKERSDFFEHNEIKQHYHHRQEQEQQQEQKSTTIEPCNYSKKIIVTDTPCLQQNETVTCWWCRIHEIRKDRACFIPLQYDEQRQIYTKSGYFCSWECVKAYNFEINDSKKTYRSYLIHSLCKKLYGTKHSQQIKPAKHWATLKQYGGNTDARCFFQVPKTTLDNVNFDLFPFLTKKHQQN